MVAARLRAVDGDLPRPKGWQLSTARMRALCACLCLPPTGSARRERLGWAGQIRNKERGPQASAGRISDGAGRRAVAWGARLLSSVSPAVLSWFSWQPPLWCKPGDSCRQRRRRWSGAGQSTTGAPGREGRVAASSSAHRLGLHAKRVRKTRAASLRCAGPLQASATASGGDRGCHPLGKRLVKAEVGEHQQSHGFSWS